MAKVKIKDKKSLKKAEEKTQGQVDFRRTKKWGIVAAKAKWLKKKK